MTTLEITDEYICGELLDSERVCIAAFGTEHSHSDPGPFRGLAAGEVLYCGDPHHDSPCRVDCHACQADGSVSEGPQSGPAIEKGNMP